MPNAAKLVAALCLAAVGFFGAVAVAPHLPDGQSPGRLGQIAAAIGALIGWRLLGRDLSPRPTLAPVGPPGFVTFASAGIKAAAVTAVATLFVTSFVVMILRSLDGRYRGPMDALVGVFALALDYGQLFFHPDVLATLILGGILAAWAAARAGRAWR
ncbi:TrgA family protein [Frigidibacter sp. MR17.14]|uniref:TrgA family protein n=1 Tax=Frigidibacter sp. MR17.14 TaxID=3126509 RepID=UPI003012A423